MARRPNSSVEDKGQGLVSAPVRISRMRLEDLPEVVSIEKLCFPQPWSQSVFVHELSNPVSCNLVARRTGPTPRVIGYVCWWLIADELHILNLAVHPQARGLGIGRRLLRRAIREARSRGAQFAWLEVRRGNVAAYCLYRRAGFTEVGLRRNYYGRGEDAVVMQLKL